MAVAYCACGGREWASFDILLPFSYQHIYKYRMHSSSLLNYHLTSKLQCHYFSASE